MSHRRHSHSRRFRSTVGVFTSARRGLTRIDCLVLMLLCTTMTGCFFGAMNAARETGRQNTCRNNLSNLARAAFSNSNRNGGRLPGYMNLLDVDNDLKAIVPYKDPLTQTLTPVSWAVMILPDIDRQVLFDQWQKTSANAPADAGAPPSNVVVNTKLYIDLFVCPSDPASSTTGTPISYVSNTGMKDLVSAVPPPKDATGAAARGKPRDWQANGVFFDNYSDHEVIKTDAATRGPMTIMRMEMVRDPKDKTVMFTENVDAGNYTFDSNGPGGTTFTTAEVETGSIYEPGPTTLTGGRPITQPTSGVLEINAEVGRGDGIDPKYCRPSSRHPGGVNVAFVGQNIQFLRENVDYFVWCKLMASEDSQMKTPGTDNLADAALRQYQMMDADIVP